MKWPICVLLALAFAASTLFAADAWGRRMVREGMSEGQVLVKIGKPDRESVDSGADTDVMVKRWIYLPAPGDEQTITTVVLRKGQVIEVDRETVR